MAHVDSTEAQRGSTEALWIVTANRLDDGGVVYLASPPRGLGDEWTRDLARAFATEDAAAAEIELTWARGQERVVCDPYVIDVARVSGRLEPTSARERIRAEGPRQTLLRLGYEVDPDEARPRLAVG